MIGTSQHMIIRTKSFRNKTNMIKSEKIWASADVISVYFGWDISTKCIHFPNPLLHFFRNIICIFFVPMVLHFFLLCYQFSLLASPLCFISLSNLSTPQCILYFYSTVFSVLLSRFSFHNFFVSFIFPSLPKNWLIIPCLLLPSSTQIWLPSPLRCRMNRKK